MNDVKAIITDSLSTTPSEWVKKLFLVIASTRTVITAVVKNMLKRYFRVKPYSSFVLVKYFSKMQIRCKIGDMTNLFIIKIQTKIE